MSQHPTNCISLLGMEDLLAESAAVVQVVLNLCIQVDFGSANKMNYMCVIVTTTGFRCLIWDSISNDHLELKEQEVVSSVIQTILTLTLEDKFTSLTQ